MNEIVDRIAKVLCERAVAENDPQSDFNMLSWSALSEEGKDEWRSDARAVIEAMREPTNSMMEAGSFAMPIVEGYSMPDDEKNVWQAMIDAALASD